ncbi:PREDICTED: uncharacterized protein LOC104819541 isoform X2 [Tarenaya hassleriana]|uniref:uncharacterized protein LOC104819541 isoform X2 n=1 Tax=Tarenaya hassleriana TaxID=28532 RepID=UPI00053C2675|nr:PREDICTED: uncharacterized protein LOC104819541 isoform X2 [Tarenaya hassleriana]
MVTDIATLEEKYIELCREQGVLPNTSILSGFFEAEVKRSSKKKCVMKVMMEKLKDIDFCPLVKLCEEISTSEVEGVDVLLRSPCTLEDAYAWSLIHSIGQKLRVVDLFDSFGKSFWRNLFHFGMNCKVLKLRSLRILKLNILGEFTQLHTLILDNNRVTGFEESCFSCMPNLTCLSMCETLVSNLWTTTAALSKLPSLEELKFQIWLCCSDSGPSRSSPPPSSSSSSSSTRDDDNVFDDMVLPLALTSELNKEVSMQERVGAGSVLPDEVSPAGSFTREVGNVGLKYISSKASPICFKKHYRMYIINSLPQLKVLDNLPIRKSDRDRAAETYFANFEHLPYRRKNKESIVRVLQKRETRSSCSGPKHAKWKSQYSYTRSLSATRMASSPWPLFHPLPVSGRILEDENMRLSPRQFEYHPLNPSLMVFGTLDGEVVVLNHERGKIVSYIPSHGELSSVLGLCWLKMYPSKLIAGSANGTLKLYDIEKASSSLTSTYPSSGTVTFDDFDQLTSVHINSTDELFLTSGYSKDVAMYDISSGTRLQVFTDMHREHINVVKFANHSPYLFATSSFDKDVKLWDLRQRPVHPCYTASSTKGNVMVCFSPDDQYLLTSAVDNEVRQLLTVDGRVHLNFEIVPTGSSMNYTRSYYMNGKDYIISGGCDENLIRICCAQTGRRLRDVSLEGTDSDMSLLFVQSLRGDPFREFNMSVLAAYTRPSSGSEIVKVNLLASKDSTKEQFHGLRWLHTNSMGG